MYMYIQISMSIHIQLELLQPEQGVNLIGQNLLIYIYLSNHQSSAFPYTHIWNFYLPAQNGRIMVYLKGH